MEAVDIIFTTLLYVMITIGILLGGVALWMKLQYKYHVRIKQLTSTNKVIIDTKARIIVHNNIKKLLTQKGKHKIAIPPDYVKEINSNGKFMYTFWLKDGIFIPSDDRFTQERFDAENEVMINSEAATAEERAMFFQEHEAAMEYKKQQKSLMEYLIPGFYVLGIIVIVIALLVFYGEIAKPVNDMGAKVVQMQENVLNFIKENPQYENVLLKGEGESEETD